MLTRGYPPHRHRWNSPGFVLVSCWMVWSPATQESWRSAAFSVEEWMHITGKYQIYVVFFIWDTCMLSKYHWCNWCISFMYTNISTKMGASTKYVVFWIQKTQLSHVMKMPFKCIDHDNAVCEHRLNKGWYWWMLIIAPKWVQTLKKNTAH